MLLDNPNNSKPKSLQNGSRFEESFIRVKMKIERNSRTMLGMGQKDMPLILYFDVYMLLHLHTVWDPAHCCILKYLSKRFMPIQCALCMGLTSGFGFLFIRRNCVGLDSWGLGFHSCWPKTWNLKTHRVGNSKTQANSWQLLRITLMG